MLKSIIKYAGLALVIIGIVLVMKNLFNSDAEINNEKKNAKNKQVTTTYSVKVSLLDEESKNFVVGANLVIKDSKDNKISEWTTGTGANLVPNLQKGTYTLSETSAPDGYNLKKEAVTFEIKNKDQDIIMYNKKMTAEEKEAYESEQRKQNTTASEVGVESTASNKEVTAIALAILSIVSGICLMFQPKDEVK